MREFLRYTLQKGTGVEDYRRTTEHNWRCENLFHQKRHLPTDDKTCERIQEKEEKMNLLFMAAGFARLKGRDGKVRRSCLTTKN